MGSVGTMRWRAPVAAAAAAYVGLLVLAVAAVRTWAPDQITLTLFGHAKTLDHLKTRLFGDLLMLFALTPLALAVEAVALGWERSSARALLVGRTPSMDTDLMVFALGQVKVLEIAGRVMMLGVSLVSGAWIAAELKARAGLAVDPSGLPFPVQVAIYFYVYAFFDYWTHRLDHSWLFWPLHRYHHAARDFCVLSAERQHPASGLAGALVINVPLAVLGASAEVMIWVNVAVALVGLLIHSRIDSDWGVVGRWLVQSPNHHRLHHKLDMSHPTANYAITPVWDRLFGTWREGAPPALPIGVDEPYRHGLWIVPDLARDYADFLWRLSYPITRRVFPKAPATLGLAQRV